MPADAPARRSRSFLLLYALANAGGVIAYLPFLTLLLPLKVERIAGDGRILVLSIALLAGAVAASLSNIAFGMLSDLSFMRGQSRRGWIGAGIVITLLSYLAIYRAASPGLLVAAVVAFQVALNAILAPLYAMIADEVPNQQKGLVGGLLTLAYPMASLTSVMLVALARRDGEGESYALLCLIIAVLVVPLLFSRPRRVAETVTERERAMRRGDFTLLWLSRLMLQIATNVLSAYLLYYFESVAPRVASGRVAFEVGLIGAAAHGLALLVAVATGALADRLQRRKPFAQGAALATAAGILVMAFAPSWPVAVIGFGLFASASLTYIAHQSALTIQTLPSPTHRGRDLGIQNLTNTLPAMLGPILTLSLATRSDFEPVLLVLVALTLGSALVIMPVRAR